MKIKDHCLPKFNVKEPIVQKVQGAHIWQPCWVNQMAYAKTLSSLLSETFSPFWSKCFVSYHLLHSSLSLITSKNVLVLFS